MREGDDFVVLEEEADLEKGQLAPVEILTGKYKGVKFKFGKVEVNRLNEKAAVLRLKFEYAIVDFNNMDTEIEKQKEFVDTAGEILNKILIDRYYNKGKIVNVGE